MGQVEANVGTCVEIRGELAYRVIYRSKGAPAEHIGVAVASWPLAVASDPMVGGPAADVTYSLMMALGQASAGMPGALRAWISGRPVLGGGPFADVSPAAFAAALTDAEITALGKAAMVQILPAFLSLSSAACCSAP